jgi:hypothetical protein
MDPRRRKYESRECQHDGEDEECGQDLRQRWRRIEVTEQEGSDGDEPHARQRQLQADAGEGLQRSRIQQVHPDELATHGREATRDDQCGIGRASRHPADDRDEDAMYDRLGRRGPQVEGVPGEVRDEEYGDAHREPDPARASIALWIHPLDGLQQRVELGVAAREHRPQLLGDAPGHAQRREVCRRRVAGEQDDDDGDAEIFVEVSGGVWIARGTGRAGSHPPRGRPIRA